MRNAWLVLKREYLERVRTKSFIISTLLLPALMAAVIILPSKLALLKSNKSRHIAVVTANRELGEVVRRELLHAGSAENRQSFTAEVHTDLSGKMRDLLRDRVNAGKLDGYLWLDDEALKTRKLTYRARETSDFVGVAAIRSAIRMSLTKQGLAERGVSSAEAEKLLQEVQLETTRIAGGKESKSSGFAVFIAAAVLVMLLYMTVMLYGVSVMRSVQEEKSSRIMEVLLSSVTSKELMAGKVLGVGAVGLSQICIWVVMSVALLTPTLLAGGLPEGLEITPGMVLFFGLFFVLGYLLYSSLYAALGAIVTSEQEAQQWQMLVALPMIISTMLMMFVIRQPNSTAAVWASMIPFCAPILMYLRIVVQTPPVWQIALCLALMVATLYGVIVLCSRIYRVGILMYGKRPTVPEIVKWLKYA